MFDWRRFLSLFKIFAARSFIMFFLTFDKNYPFLILQKNIKCLHEKKFRHSHVPGYEPDRLAIFVNHSLDLTKKFVSYFPIRTIRVRLSRCCAFVITIKLIQHHSKPLDCPQIDIKTLWDLPIVASDVNAKPFTKFLIEWIVMVLLYSRSASCSSFQHGR